MFIDKVKLKLTSGTGGNGMVAFRREKYVPKGGPAGGDGGKGGDIIFVANEGLSTLLELRYQKHIKAHHGVNGGSRGLHGKYADNFFVQVPVGTIITDDTTGAVLADLVEHKQQAIVTKGGRGGRGNIRFASSRVPAPDIAENGEPGEEREITCELKLLADVGLVGFPSVGKSTLISVVSAATPKIADYHFTTLIPNLGVVSTKDQRSFVMADMPGLIQGASKGIGLGHEFLRHIERTRVLVHVIDMAAVDNRDPLEDYIAIKKELNEYNSQLNNRPQVIVANKMDLPEAKENLIEFKADYKDEYPIFPISTFTHEGIDELIYKIADIIDQTPKFELYKQEEIHHVTYKFEKDADDFIIELDDDGVYVVKGAALERLIKMTNFTRDSSAARFARIIREMGIDAALREKGLQNGDTVRLMTFEFEFID